MVRSADRRENADEPLAGYLDEVDATRQRRSWWPACRNFHMSKLAATAAAAATVLVVAVVGEGRPRKRERRQEPRSAGVSISVVPAG